MGILAREQRVSALGEAVVAVGLGYPVGWTEGVGYEAKEEGWAEEAVGTGGKGKGPRLVRGIGMAVAAVQALLRGGGGGRECSPPLSEGTTLAKRRRQWARIRDRGRGMGRGEWAWEDAERGGRLTRSLREGQAALELQRRLRREGGGGGRAWAGPHQEGLHKG